MHISVIIMAPKRDFDYSRSSWHRFMSDDGLPILTPGSTRQQEWSEMHRPCHRPSAKTRMRNEAAKETERIIARWGPPLSHYVSLDDGIAFLVPQD